MDLHKQIREARKQAGLTQEQLAERAHVGRNDVSRLEKGANVTMRTLNRIVGALPTLEGLTIGDQHFRKDGAAMPEKPADPEQPLVLDDVLNRIERMHLAGTFARAFLAALAGEPLAGPQPPPSTAPQPPPSTAAPTQEVSLLRTMLQIMLELIGAKER